MKNLYETYQREVALDWALGALMFATTIAFAALMPVLVWMEVL